MRILTLFFILISFSISADQNIDFKLKQIINIYDLKGFDCKSTHKNNIELAELGEFLFESKLLSGSGDTACQTCHLKELARTDGLPVAVGVGGTGESTARMLDGEGIIVPRNAFTLNGRGHRKYETFFWDGKVEQQADRLVSVIGDGESKGFESSLAVAAILPLLARDEFLGIIGENHDGFNDIDSKYHSSRYYSASKVIQDRIQNSQGEEWEKLREKFSENGISTSDLELSDIGNALASFIINKESCVKTSWSEYIKGDTKALTIEQKKGAYVFYGKGRCVACHSGDLLTNFSFQSIATPQGKVGVSIVGQDLGRAEISLKTEDRFKFKVPSLLSVSQTKPYGHNGVFNTLEEVVLFHINPMPFFKNYQWNENDFYNYGRVLSSRSKTLSYIDVLDKEEFENLLLFLEII